MDRRFTILPPISRRKQLIRNTTEMYITNLPCLLWVLSFPNDVLVLADVLPQYFLPHRFKVSVKVLC